MTAPRLLHMGSVVVDLVYEVDRLPTAGGDRLASDAYASVGGGFNVMAAAVRSGLATAYGGPHGSGPFGDLARAALAALGVELLLPRATAGDTGTSVALVTPDGERSFVSHVGVEGVRSAAGLGPIRVGAADWIYLSGYALSYPGSGPALAAWLAALPPERPVLLDPGPLGSGIPADRLAAVLARTTWLSCSRGEAATLAGCADPDAAAAALCARLGPAGGVIVRLGPDGCLLRSRDGTTGHHPGFPTRAIDTNGAGDAHAGAFLAALSRGAAPGAAARYANAAAAIAVSRRGPATAPTRAEIEGFLASASHRPG